MRGYDARRYAAPYDRFAPSRVMRLFNGIFLGGGDGGHPDFRYTAEQRVQVLSLLCCEGRSVRFTEGRLLIAWVYGRGGVALAPT